MVVPRDNRPDRKPSTRSASVRSILALAGGAAAAVPLTGATAEAAIIVDSSLSGTVIGWNTGAGQTPSVTTSSLPGGGGFTINTRANVHGERSAYSFVGVAVAWAGVGNGVFRRGLRYPDGAYLAPAGATVAGGSSAAAFANVNLGTGVGSNDGNIAFAGPPSKYLLFSFTNTDTSQTNYGWIELTATTTGVSGGRSVYSATLGDWAYDNSGATILAGQVPVPEPATAALAMGGALVAGAAGLRRWRKQRATRVAPAGEQA